MLDSNLIRRVRPGQFAVALAATTAIAGAQNFNLDGGATGSQPAATYAAGAGQAGFWNEVPFGATGQALSGLSGSATSVTVTATAAQNFFFNNTGTLGNDELLMDNLLDAVSLVVVSGLAFGDYDIYTYAWAPDSAGGLTNVQVMNSPDPIKVCGGIWPVGGHQEDVTYVKHAVTIDAGNPDLTIAFTVAALFASFNGLQIVMDNATIGTTYCSPAIANSTGSPGVAMATGSAVAADNFVTLSASGLPNSQFGFFLNSMTQGFVPNPNNSQGNLCLGGAIGRYNAAGQLFNTGATGSGSLALSLPNTPTPTGPTAIVAGQTWNFQCWYRDLNPTPTSNFTNGISITFQ